MQTHALAAVPQRCAHRHLQLPVGSLQEESCRFGIHLQQPRKLADQPCPAAGSGAGGPALLCGHLDALECADQLVQLSLAALVGAVRQLEVAEGNKRKSVHDEDAFPKQPPIVSPHQLLHI
eukprot:SAG22_NODE_6523_length_843_cov_1.313172_1_plen_121_part_00